MRPNELMAAAILSELLDARAELNDRPRTGPGRFDWRLIGRDRTYAIEVTEHNDQAQRSFEAQTTAAGGIYREQPTLDGFYSIRVESASAPSKLWSQLPALIRDHFSDGVNFQELASMRWNTDNPRHTYARTLADLGVLWITAQR